MQGAALDPSGTWWLLDPYNPRSIAFQMVAIVRHLGELPALSADGIPERTRGWRAGSWRSCARGRGGGEFDAVRLTTLGTDLERLADGISARYFPTGPHAPRPEKLTGLA